MRLREFSEKNGQRLFSSWGRHEGTRIAESLQSDGVRQLSFVYFIRSCQILTTKVTFSEEITSIDVNDKNMASLQTNKLWLHSIIIKGYKETSQIDFDNCSA